jgi:hypothetical protein
LFYTVIYNMALAMVVVGACCTAPHELQNFALACMALLQLKQCDMLGGGDLMLTCWKIVSTTLATVFVWIGSLPKATEEFCRDGAGS